MPAPSVSTLERMLVATCDGDFGDSCGAELSSALPIKETGRDHPADSGAFLPRSDRFRISCELHGSKASGNDSPPASVQLQSSGEY